MLTELTVEVESSSPADSTLSEWVSPKPRGKFLWSGNEKLWVKGVTYGTFHPRDDNGEYDRSVVETDFLLMKQNHINSIRTYTIPPRWMLDLAESHHIRVFVGFPWEEHIAFLDDASIARSIRERLKHSVHEIAGHPAVLCFAIGNEIPSSIVRWHGPQKIQQYLRTLYKTAKNVDPNLLVTYVNYPSTEYLHLPFLDLFSFNVFLESDTDFKAYLLRLQNIAGEKPLIITEVGIDSRRNGLEAQATLLRTQIRTSYRSACAGVFAFSWTDEWYRGGFDVDDWDFGLTTRDRKPKPALNAVRDEFAQAPIVPSASSPTISVVVCSYNGSKTIDKCMQSLFHLEYQNYEVIVIDDGSTDSTASIVSKYPARLIRTSNHGLSAARNRGMTEARGEIIAFMDDDAYADPHWLNYLAIAFQETDHACIGGPNLVPPEDGWMAQCVARAPGGPIHVLLSDEQAEHVPGCNLAVRKSAMQEIGGFDTRFRTAGDDVDFCWRLQNTGFTIGYHPGAMVWHHRRNSISAYFRQQRGYGKAEVLLSGKWPEKYNSAGHVSWAGRIYQGGPFSAGRIYSGVWGTAPFQSIYQKSSGIFSVFLVPEWILIILFLFCLTGMGVHWSPLFFASFFLFLAILIPVIHAARSARATLEWTNGSRGLKRFKRFVVCAFLHCVQSFARFIGRWPLWRPSYKGFVFPVKKKISIWTEHWQEPCTKLSTLLETCKNQGAIVACGSSFDAWDLETKGGAFGSARILMAVEEHGNGKQMTIFQIYPYCHWLWPAVIGFVLIIATAATISTAWLSALLLLGFSVLLGTRIFLESGRAVSALVHSIRLFETQNVPSEAK